MLQANTLLTLSGFGLAVLLLGMGIAIGYRLGRGNAKMRHTLDQGERERMLQLLQELGAWTSEYSGNVSDYQNRLGELSAAVRVDPNDKSTPRVVALLQQIMESNEQLQSRLEAAENQLEKQTKQIESYLTEARTDGLTGLYNRRALDNRLDELFAAFLGGGPSFVLVLVDIDHFKSINDNHGHQAGDQVLQQVAKMLKTELQDSIMVARFGGEEFAIVMKAPMRVAADKMNAVRRTLAGQPMVADNKELTVTCSIGVSEPRDDIVIGPVVRRADEALYAAKNIGRNRVYFHDGNKPSLVGAPEVARR